MHEVRPIADGVSSASLGIAGPPCNNGHRCSAQILTMVYELKTNFQVVGMPSTFSSKIRAMPTCWIWIMPMVLPDVQCYGVHPFFEGLYSVNGIDTSDRGF